MLPINMEMESSDCNINLPRSLQYHMGWFEENLYSAWFGNLLKLCCSTSQSIEWIVSYFTLFQTINPSEASLFPISNRLLLEKYSKTKKRMFWSFKQMASLLCRNVGENDGVVEIIYSWWLMPNEKLSHFPEILNN